MDPGSPTDATPPADPGGTHPADHVPPPLPPDYFLPPPLPPADSVPVVTPIAEPPRRARPTVIAPPPGLSRRPDGRVGRTPPARRSVRHAKPLREVTPVLPLLITLGTFAAMMVVSFGQGVYAMVAEADVPTAGEAQIKDRMVYEMAVFEGLDTVIVLLGIVIAGRPLAGLAARNPLVVWLLAVPAFVGLLGINVGYHALLQWMVTALTDEPPAEVIDIGLKDGAWAILLVCIQPAVVEEVFFRYLLFGHLRPHLGTHGAVWLTAVIFGMAHLGNIPGWPVLMLVGAGLGYARAYSGGLALPILLHFLHNLAVLVIDHLVTG